MGVLFYIGVGGILYFLYQLYVMMTETGTVNRPVSNGKPSPQVYKKLSHAASVIKERLKIKSSQPAIAVSADKLLWNRSTLSLAPDAMSELFRYLGEIGTVYIIVMVCSDEEEAAFRALVSSTSLYGIVPTHRILFCETDVGKKAVIRQLDPHCYVDSDLTSCKETAQRSPAVAIVGTEDISDDGIVCIRSISDLISV